MLNKSGSGAVVPPKAANPSLAAGEYEITIRLAEPVGDDAADGVYATCVYPDGWGKDHQVMPDDVTGLFEKVVGQLRGRYGAGEVKLLAAPKKIVAGASLKVEV